MNADVLDQVGQRLLLRELRPQFAHFLYHDMARDANAAGRFADVISRAKDELVTPDEYLAFAHARRQAFEFEHGVGEFEKTIERLREREALGNLWQVQQVRRELSKGPDAARKIADREARRDVGGTGEAIWYRNLTEEQQRLAKGLKPTYVRDAEAFDVLRLIEEAEAYAIYQRTLRERGLLDFGEQQLLTIQLLTERPNICRATRTSSATCSSTSSRTPTWRRSCCWSWSVAGRTSRTTSWWWATTTSRSTASAAPATPPSRGSASASSLPRTGRPTGPPASWPASRCSRTAARPGTSCPPPAA